MVGELWVDDWESAAGFVAEFCALGGTVVERDWFSLQTPDPSAAARRHADADGVLLLTEYTPPAAYLAAYGQRGGPTIGEAHGRRIVVRG